MRRKLLATGVLAAILAAVTVPNAAAQDDPRTKPVFNTDHDIAEILKAAKHQGKALILILENGARFTGKIKSVSTHAVIVTGLERREFFDAFIRLDSIAAMEERVRLR